LRQIFFFDGHKGELAFILGQFADHSAEQRHILENYRTNVKHGRRELLDGG
jgi:hypothetical protein